MDANMFLLPDVEEFGSDDNGRAETRRSSSRRRGCSGSGIRSAKGRPTPSWSRRSLTTRSTSGIAAVPLLGDLLAATLRSALVRRRIPNRAGQALAQREVPDGSGGSGRAGGRGAGRLRGDHSGQTVGALVGDPGPGPCSGLSCRERSNLHTATSNGNDGIAGWRRSHRSWQSADYPSAHSCPAHLDKTLGNITAAAVEVLPEVKYASISVKHADGCLESFAPTDSVAPGRRRCAERTAGGSLLRGRRRHGARASPHMADDMRFPCYAPVAAFFGIEAEAGTRLFDAPSSSVLSTGDRSNWAPSRASTP